MTHPIRRYVGVLAATLLGAACASESREQPVTRAAPEEPAAQGRLVGVMTGFHGPESVHYDAEQDVWFVSNMLGTGSARDGNGYIVRVSGDLRTSELFVVGGRNGAVLDAPKGMDIAGETLWVADIDVLRGFDRRTGAPVATVDLRGRARMLNDVAAAPDGSVYVTDTGILMTSKGVIYLGDEQVFRIAQDGAASVVAAGAALALPNGIVWDEAKRHLIVASFDPFEGKIYTLVPGSGERRMLVRGRGRFDGLHLLEDGTLLYTSWDGASLDALRAGEPVRIASHLTQPAGFGVDPRRRRAAVPQVILGRVEFYELPRWEDARVAQADERR